VKLSVFSAPSMSWKLRLLVLTKPLFRVFRKMTVTQKADDYPKLPRFFEKKDSIVITAKIANITNETKKGMAVCNF
jgi:hypothetical protein